MFKGIVEGTGRILKISPLKKGRRLSIAAPFSLSSIKKGDSIAVNGCCLTVVKKNPPNPPFSKGGQRGFFTTDLSHETLAVTNLKTVSEGSLVNLERSLRLGDRIDGHLVQGHVDGMGRIVSVKKIGTAWEIEISLPAILRRYVIAKGSIAVDGISMTVNRLRAGKLTLVVIPHTFQVTNLKAKRAGDPVNLEVDLIGKYIEKLVRHA